MSISLTPAARSQVRTVLLFFVLLGGLNGIYQLEKRVDGRFIDLPYTRLVTAASERLAQVLLPFPVERRGPITLGSEGAAVVIRSGCNGIEALFLMLAGILAVPATWRQRGEALLTYLPLLFGLNLLRVLLLLYVMARHPDYIDIFHYQVGQGVMVIFVLIFWVHHVRAVEG